MSKYIIPCFIVLLLVESCGKRNVHHTESGMKYVLHDEHQGPKPVLGDYVTFDMVYKTDQDSILYDTRNASPFRIQLLQIPFAGSLEEGLTYLSEGDSATFYVSSDSLRKNMLQEHLEAGRESKLRPGTLATFAVRLHRVQRKADAEKEIALRLKQRKDDEPRLIREFLERENITAVADSHGIYRTGAVNLKDGIRDGDTVAVRFTGKYLNGRVFFSNLPDGPPLNFVQGEQQVIPGWETSLRGLSAGAKIRLVIPSDMAYGEKGLFSSKRGDYVVPPNTPVTYDLEIVSVRRGGKVAAR